MGSYFTFRNFTTISPNDTGYSGSLLSLPHFSYEVFHFLSHMVFFSHAPDRLLLQYVFCRVSYDMQVSYFLTLLDSFDGSLGFLLSFSIFENSASVWLGSVRFICQYRQLRFSGFLRFLYHPNFQ